MPWMQRLGDLPLLSEATRGELLVYELGKTW